MPYQPGLRCRITHVGGAAKSHKFALNDVLVLVGVNDSKQLSFVNVRDSDDAASAVAAAVDAGTFDMDVTEHAKMTHITERQLKTFCDDAERRRLLVATPLPVDDVWRTVGLSVRP